MPRRTRAPPAAGRSRTSGRPDLSLKDEAGLNGKVDAAERKLTEGKPADAAAALGGIRVKVEALLTAPTPKVDAAGGQAILDATTAAVACVQPASATA